MAAPRRARSDRRSPATVLRGRAALYARQSITREGSASLDVQVEACREAAARLKLDVVAELVEAPSTSGYSNRGRNRPKFGELLDLIRKGEVDCVVAYKTDRLSRGGGPGWAPLVDAFEEAGRDPDRAVATTDGWVSEFEIGIRSAMDREESKKTSDRMQAVRAREAKEGVPRIGGRRPYGFARDMSEHVDDEVSRIEEAAGRVLAGESVWSICTDWNKAGVPTVTGKAWTVQTLTSILTSPRIAGFRTHRGTVVGEGQWKRIVDEDRHDALVAALAPRKSKPRKGRTYPLVGFLVCGKCGGPLRSLTRENGGRSYACRKGPGMGGCGGIRIQANGLEAYVRDLICGMLADPVTRAAMAELAPVASPGSVSDALSDLHLRRERLIDLYTDGDIDRATFRSRQARLDQQIRVAEVDRTGGSAAMPSIPSTFGELVATWDESGIDFQRSLIEILIASVTVEPATSRRRAFDPHRLSVLLRA
jgi:DNA invertase Pin-like site-specific DNA recombinase